jgi:hypothetical protein
MISRLTGNLWYRYEVLSLMGNLILKAQVSLADIGSGLWPYTHNCTNTTNGGWWSGEQCLRGTTLED